MSGSWYCGWSTVLTETLFWMIQNTVLPMEMWYLAKSWCSGVHTTKPHCQHDQTTNKSLAISLFHHSSWYRLSVSTISSTFNYNCLGSSLAVLSLKDTKLVYCEHPLCHSVFNCWHFIERFFLHPSDYLRQQFLSTSTVWDHPLQFFLWSHQTGLLWAHPLCWSIFN